MDDDGLLMKTWRVESTMNRPDSSWGWQGNTSSIGASVHDTWDGILGKHDTRKASLEHNGGKSYLCEVMVMMFNTDCKRASRSLVRRALVVTTHCGRYDNKRTRGSGTKFALVQKSAPTRKKIHFFSEKPQLQPKSFEPMMWNKHLLWLQESEYVWLGFQSFTWVARSVFASEILAMVLICDLAWWTHSKLKDSRARRRYHRSDWQWDCIWCYLKAIEYFGTKITCGCACAPGVNPQRNRQQEVRINPFIWYYTIYFLENLSDAIIPLLILNNDHSHDICCKDFS